MAGDFQAAPDSPARPSLVENLLPGILNRAKVVVSPYPFATQDDDSLRVTVANALPNVSVEVHGRLVTRAGDARPFRFVVTPTSDRVPTTVDFPLTGGFVSNLSAFATGATPFVGQTFVIVQIVRGAAASAFVLGTLLAAPVTASQPIGWPGTPIATSVEGEPYLRVITGTTPAAGANIVETVPTGARWELLTWCFSFTTSATVVNRKVFVQPTVGSTIYGVTINFSTIPASTTAVYTFGPNLPSTSDQIEQLYQAAFFNRVLLQAGASIVTSARNLQPGDQFFNVSYVVREWLDLR